MSKPFNLLFFQLVITSLCFPIFYFFGKVLQPLNSFIFSFISYWVLLSIGIFSMLIFDNETTILLRQLIFSSRKKLLLLFNFFPIPALVLIVFIPNISHFSIPLISMVLAIAVSNGILEELFWRGIVLSKYSHSNLLLAASTTVFALFHFAFLLLPLQYHGGALNLVGGAAIMGFLWIFISKLTRNISLAILAHIAVNFLAFCGLFIENGLV